MTENYYEKKENRIARYEDLAKKYEGTEKGIYYAEKAKAAKSNNAISSDAPDKIELMEAELEKETKLHELVKLAFKKCREYLKNGEKTDFTGLDEKTVNLIKNPSKRLYFTNSHYVKMRELKKRIEYEIKHNNDSTWQKEFNGYKLVDNVELNRVQFIFEKKPDKEVHQQLRHNGFVFSFKNMAYQRMRKNAYYATKSMLAYLKDYYSKKEPAKKEV